MPCEAPGDVTEGNAAKFQSSELAGGICFSTYELKMARKSFRLSCLDPVLRLFKKGQSQRIYRDPVHNIIRLRTGTDEGQLMMRLIDAPDFQKPRLIKQLGLFILIRTQVFEAGLSFL